MSRLAGHGLAHEGAAYLSHGRARNDTERGMGLCECGMYSPPLKNRSRRKQWHRDHKSDIVAGGTGVVWKGVPE